jgi:hypothetical protein
MRAAAAATLNKEVQPCTERFSWPMTARPMATSTGSGREPGLVAVGHDSSPSGTIDFSENMLIVEGMVFVPDNRRYLTQAAGWWRQTLAACRRGEIQGDQ